MEASFSSSYQQFASRKVMPLKECGIAPPTILVVDDEPSMLRYLCTLLEDTGFQVSTALSGHEALERIEKGLRPDVVLLDSFMPGMEGLEVLRRILAEQRNCKVIMLSCINDNRRVAQAMQLGARDFLSKPVRKQDLVGAISQCLDLSKKAPAHREIESEKIQVGPDAFFVFGSQVMRDIRMHAALVARVDIPVLILGESGTGKEVLAHFIHNMSPRAHKPFLKVNCAAVPPDLLESELFGYEAGAFTGANRSKPGKFDLCNHGTILLDEIGEMHPLLQAKLLQVLQDGSYSRLGGRSTVKVDVRIIAATNVDIGRAMVEKQFRQDLYYRLNGLTIAVPPLRERKEEIPLLVRHFMEQLAGKYARHQGAVSHTMLEACMQHSWPGNLRELQNFVKRYLVLGDERILLSELVSSASATPAAMVPSATSPQSAKGLKALVKNMKGEAEMEAIKEALGNSRWNRKQAAADLQISYKALLYKVRQYGIEPTRS
jgi:two-component system response regulator AtoC